MYNRARHVPKKYMFKMKGRCKKATMDVSLETKLPNHWSTSAASSGEIGAKHSANGPRGSRFKWADLLVERRPIVTLWQREEEGATASMPNSWMKRRAEGKRGVWGSSRGGGDTPIRYIDVPYPVGSSPGNRFSLSASPRGAKCCLRPREEGKKEGGGEGE